MPTKLSCPPPTTADVVYKKAIPRISIAQQQDRENWVDWARSFAIISIVFCHVTEFIYRLNLEGYNQATALDQVLAQTFFTFGRLGVPIFLFLSGYLLLSRHRCKSLGDCLKFLKKKWLPLLLCYEIWIVLYNAFIYVFHDKYFAWHTQSLHEMAYQFALKTYPPMPHLWYMPMIVCAYLAIPVISYCSQRFGDKAFYVIFGFLLGYSFTFKYSISTYLTYICFGHIFYLNIKGTSKKSLYISALLFSALFVYTVFMQIHHYDKGRVHNVWYTEHVLMFATVFLFPCLRLLNQKRVLLVEELSKAAFAIYLLHYPCMRLIGEIIKPLAIASSVKCFILLPATMFISYSVFKVISRHKELAKTLFLYK